MTARDYLAAVQQRADAATDGPWVTEGAHVVHPPWEADDDTYWVADAFEEGSTAEFIAAARTDVPCLVAALTAALDLADAWEAAGPTRAKALRAAITAALTPKEND